VPIAEAFESLKAFPFLKLKTICGQLIGKILFGFLAIKESALAKVIFLKFEEGLFRPGATFAQQKKLNIFCWK
jgi:hypothetical protein